MLLSVDSALDPGQVQQILQDTALDLGPAGFDTSFGHGLIQIYDALDTIAPDSVAPTWPNSAELSVSNITGTSVRLGWPAASDNRGILGYRVYRGNTLIKTTSASATATTVSGLNPATSYTLRVRAVDPSGNLGPALSTTVATLDTVAPTWPRTAGLTVLAYGETSLQLAWDPTTDNVGVTGYRLRVDGEDVPTLTDRQYTVTGLQPGTEYRVEVSARDQAGNWSPALETIVYTAQRFGDTAGHTFHGDINWMSGTGVTWGRNPPVDDRFCPDDPVTRGQIGAFLVRALGLTVNTHPGFGDVRWLRRLPRTSGGWPRRGSPGAATSRQRPVLPRRSGDSRPTRRIPATSPGRLIDLRVGGDHDLCGLDWTRRAGRCCPGT